MRMLRGNPDGTAVRIYATNVDPGAPALTACDVSALEPRRVSNHDYAEFALDFCRRHHIDVLIPPRRLEALAGRADDFAAVGTRLMCSPATSVDILTSKARTFQAARAAGIPVPDWRVVRRAGELREAVAAVTRDGELACVKPAGEFSAFGFRILDDTPLTLGGLLAPAEPIVTVDAVENALRRAEEEGQRIPGLMVMPFLDGPEISVDCLSSPDGAVLSSVARAKDGRYRIMLHDPEVTAIAHRLVEHFRLSYLTNVQLRHRGGRPVLLEANPRPSAGLFQTTCTGVNLYWAAVRLLLSGSPGALPEPRLGGRVAVTEAITEVAAPLALAAVGENVA